MPRTLLYVSHILSWADTHCKRTGSWPNLNAGRISDAPDETWRRVDSALRIGLRGLRGGSSLARLLAEQRGVRNRSCLPRLTAKQILAWADAHYASTGTWPTSESGPIRGASGETWKAIDHALRLGMRSLPGNSSLSRLLSKQRGVRNIQNLPRLSIVQVLAWVDEHHRRTGRWPTSDTGPVADAPGETWSAVNAALQKGRRGFPGGSSLARLLAKRRGVRNPKQPPRLSVSLILKWADKYKRLNGLWPTRHSGSIEGMNGETWAMIDRALTKRQRGLNSKFSLFHLLKQHRHAMKHMGSRSRS
ncbi:MAG TPA: hypothetical protein VKU02_26510 [Gemmataceae bacterium]|nr:hypothetical protein [Gemmataceae bacterium]